MEKLPVLVYHQIEDPVRSDVSCTPAQFLAQMKALLENGFTPLDLGQTRVFLGAGAGGVSKPVLITFDDGYESLFTHALPVARQLGVPMTVFMVTSRLGRKPQFLRYLDAEQIRKMAASGFIEFGSHTHDLHTNILNIYQAFRGTPNPVSRLLRNDLDRSRKKLEFILGKPPFAIAWPYGKYNRDLSGVAREAGFFLHFCSRYGYNFPGSDPFEIKRIPVTCRDTPESVLKKVRGGFPFD